MQLMENLFKTVRGIFNEGTDEIFFYVLVFLLFFNKNSTRSHTRAIEENDSGYILFFIVLFLFLLISDNMDRKEESAAVA